MTCFNGVGVGWLGCMSHDARYRCRFLAAGDLVRDFLVLCVCQLAMLHEGESLCMSLLGTCFAAETSRIAGHGTARSERGATSVARIFSYLP